MHQRNSAHRRRLAAAFLAQALLWPPCQAESLFSLYTGSSFTRDSSLHISQRGNTRLALHDVNWDADPFKPAPYYGLRFTHFLEQHPAWGFAIDYTHYKMLADTNRTVQVSGAWKGTPVAGPARMDQYVQRFELSHGVNMLSLNGIYRWQDLSLLAGRLQPYVGLGLVHYRPHSENTVDNVAHETGYDASGYGYQLLGGAQYRLGSRWGLFGEVKFNSGHARVDIAGGEADTRLRTLHALGGLQYRF
jgi:opacity protein-like surface antigen